VHLSGGVGTEWTLLNEHLSVRANATVFQQSEDGDCRVVVGNDQVLICGQFQKTSVDAETRRYACRSYRRDPRADGPGIGPGKERD
jgi:hypothetical protein